METKAEHEEKGVFRPTSDEFSNFAEYVSHIESKNAHQAGIAKIIPPKQWVPKKNGYNFEEMDITIPVQQIQTVKYTDAEKTCYTLFSRSKKEEIGVKKFWELAQMEEYAPPQNMEHEELESRYWETVTVKSRIYGADVSASLFDQNCEKWNPRNLGTILDKVKDVILGVNTPYLYFGMWRTSFAWHTEDANLYSFSYLHFGEPKIWYTIPPEHNEKFENLARRIYPEDDVCCPQFMKGKFCIIPPETLKKEGIPYHKFIQKAGVDRPPFEMNQ